MADNTIELPFEADTSKATKSIKNFSDDAVKQVDKVSNSFKLLGVAATVALVFKGFSSAISAAQESDRAIQKLNVSLANTGDFSVQSSKDIQEYASELEALTGITDEAILGSFALAKSFGISNKQAKELTSAAVELSAATGVDLDTAIKQLGGTFSGTVGRLSKLSPEFKNLTQAQLQSGAAIDLVNKRFKGTAEALSGDFEGSVNKVGIAFGNIFESLGKVITQNPAVLIALQELASAFNDIAGAVADQQGTFSSSLTPIITSTAELSTQIAGISSVVLEIAQAAVTGLLIVTKGFVNLVGALLETLISPLEATKKALGIFGFEIISIFKDIINSEVITGFLKLTGADVEGLKSNIQNALVQAADAADTKLAKPQFITDIQNSLDGITVSTVAAFDGSIAAVDRLGTAAAKVAEKTRGLQKTVVDNSSALKNSAKDFESTKDSADALRASLESLADKYKGSIDKLKASTSDLQKSLDTQNKTAQELIDVERERATQVSRNAAAEADALFKLGKLSQDQLTNIGLQIAENESLAESVKKVSQAQLDANNLKETFAQAGAVTNQVFNGEEGARQFISGAAAKLSDKFLFEGAGQFVGPLITALSKGGDFAKTAITEFIESIPVLIDNIIEAIPVIVDTLVDVLINRGGLVKIATALVKASVTSTPIFARALIQALAESAGLLVDAIMSYLGPRLGETFAQIGQNLRNGFNDFFKPLIDPIQRLINAVDGLASSFGGGGGKGVLGETADRIGLGSVTDKIGSIGKGIFRAQGGLVPGGAPFVSRGTDTVPAMLTPGELVLPTDLVGQLSAFLSGQSSTSSGGGSDMILAAILQAVTSPVVVQSEVKVNENAFADILLQLNRQNARIA